MYQLPAAQQAGTCTVCQRLHDTLTFTYTRPGASEVQVNMKV